MNTTSQASVISTILRRWVEDANIKQKDLANELNCSPGHLSKILNGKVVAAQKQLIQISQITQNSFKEIEDIQRQGKKSYKNVPAIIDERYIYSLYDSLKDGDEVHVISSYQFIEANSFSIRELIYSSIKRGVVFKYFYPLLTDNDELSNVERYWVEGANRDINFLKEEFMSFDCNKTFFYERSYFDQHFSPYSKIICIYSQGDKYYKEMILETQVSDIVDGSEMCRPLWVRLSKEYSSFFLGWCIDS